MNLSNKKYVLININKFRRLKKDKLKSNNSLNQRNKYSISSIINNNIEIDRDKLNLENINYLEKDFMNKKIMKAGNSISVNHNFSNKEIYNPLIINQDSLFGNQLIRNYNKIRNIQINIFEQEISMKKLLKKKKNSFSEEKYEVIKDDKSSTKYNKSKILNIIRTQTKSNFNNKYKLMFKSCNKKKRNFIQNYFSLIKKDLKDDYEKMNSTSRKIYSKKNKMQFNDTIFKTREKKTINKDFLNYINNSIIKKEKKKILFIPILNSNPKIKKEVKQNI